jgi:hypothetical protein
MRAFFSQKKLSSQKILAENKVSGISADNRDEHFGIASGGNRKLGGRRFGMK